MLVTVIQLGNWWALMYLLVGILLGGLALWLDKHILYRYYNNTGEPTPYLLSRSLLFLLILLPLSIFVVSSTGSFIGQGFVLALLGGLWLEMMKVRSDTLKFNQHFGQKAKKPFTDKEVYFMIRIFSVFIILIISIVLL